MPLLSRCLSGQCCCAPLSVPATIDYVKASSDVEPFMHHACRPCRCHEKFKQAAAGAHRLLAAAADAVAAAHCGMLLYAQQHLQVLPACVICGSAPSLGMTGPCTCTWEETHVGAAASTEIPGLQRLWAVCKDRCGRVPCPGCDPLRGLVRSFHLCRMLLHRLRCCHLCRWDAPCLVSPTEDPAVRQLLPFL